ncbi:MAG: hypothetical protein FWG75_03320 [Cystobacterineae bacterium]|nr:hypothetical protein [Cystobacterineae bacterium]
MPHNETLNALENALKKIVDPMDDILDVLKDNLSLLQEIAQNGGDFSQMPPNALSILEGIASALEEVPWILSETGLAIATALSSRPKDAS